MKNKLWLHALLSIVAAFFMFGCAAKAPIHLPAFSPADFGTNQTSKVDNFLVILDASSSMLEAAPQGGTKFAVAKAVADRMNMTIPELGQTAGLRSFGHDKKVSNDFVQLVYGMDSYNSSVMAEKLATISSAGGISLLKKSLVNAIQDLKDTEGVRTAVIIISDGLDMDNAKNGAKALKDAFGDNLCIYPIQVGDSSEGRELLEEISRIGGCGFYSNADTLLSSEGMAKFVETVFLGKASSDTHAWKNYDDVKETNTMNDSDGDGVYDKDDKCPNTPKGARINAVGCWVLNHVLFDFDKATIKSSAHSQLNEVVKIMEDNPDMKVKLQGHTDSTGSAAYNKDLSIRRASSVMEYLNNNGINNARMKAEGFGEENPAFPNDTKENRMQNRRVEIHPIVVMP